MFHVEHVKIMTHVMMFHTMFHVEHVKNMTPVIFLACVLCIFLTILMSWQGICKARYKS